MSAIPDKSIDLDKGYYCAVYAMIHFKKEDGFDRKDDLVDMNPDTDEEDMEDVRLDNKR